jgi:hypothetical protein
MEEHETEIAYWAGRLIGYDQAWEVAEEIVETIKKAQNQALRIHDVVGRSEQLQPEQECYKSGEPCKYGCSGLCKESC